MPPKPSNQMALPAHTLIIIITYSGDAIPKAKDSAGSVKYPWRALA